MAVQSPVAIRELSSDYSAKQLATRLMAYWIERGWPRVNCWAEKMEWRDARGNSNGDGHLYVVRSNMISGYPPK